MELPSGQLGRSSLYFLVGYTAVLATFSLAISAKTSAYSKIAEAVLSTPLPSAILGAPLIFVVGILIHLLRGVVLRNLFRQGPYKLSVLTAPERGALRTAAIAALAGGFGSIASNRSEDFDQLQAQLDPKFNPYQAHERWLYDLLADLVPIALFAGIAILSRAIAFSLTGLDWAILTSAIAIILVAGLSMPRLRREFTIRDVSHFVLRHQPEKKGICGCLPSADGPIRGGIL